MVTLKEKLYRVSNEILDFLLSYKKDHPNFTFALRERDSAQSEEKRLELGQWFQGSNYIYVPLFGKGDTARKIKTLGFVLTFEEDGEISENYIEVSFKGGVTDSSELNFHNDLARELNISLNRGNFGSFYFEDPDKYIENLKEYVQAVYPLALKLLDKYDLTSKYVISEDIFSKRLSKVTAIRSKLETKQPIEKVPNVNDEYLNTILYGPPGTGKTFKLQNTYLPQYVLSNTVKTREEHLIEIIEELSWWQVIALTLKKLDVASVPEILGHEYIKIKSGLSRNKRVLHTLWQQLQSHAVIDSKTVNVTGRNYPNIFDKKENSKWYIVKDKLEEASDLDDYIERISDYEKGTTITQKNYSIITFHQSFSYEDFIEGIKPVFSEEDVEIKYEIQKGVFYTACEKAVQLAGYNSLKECLEDSKASRRQRLTSAKKFGFFIDEINRANVSSVFGELITLIESDKRLGAINEITDMKLPYSKANFGVPLNLRIVGTMNTADRSVEALDTALRRRFSFIEMFPLPESLNVKICNVELSLILFNINERIETLLDRDHCIGHSFFIDVKSELQLLDVFYNKIIPLLQEFFYGDFGKIGLILGNGFVKVKSRATVLLPIEGYEVDDTLNEKPSFEIIDFRIEVGFEEALKILINKTL